MNDSTKSAVLGGVALVVLGGAAYLFFKPRAAVSFPTRYTIEGVCLACHAQDRVDAKLTDPPPHRCSKCGQSAIFGWYYCQDCKKRFVPNPVKSADRISLPVIPSCGGCGSQRVSQYASDDPEQTPAGDAPLPKWPPD